MWLPRGIAHRRWRRSDYVGTHRPPHRRRRRARRRPGRLRPGPGAGGPLGPAGPADPPAGAGCARRGGREARSAPPAPLTAAAAPQANASAQAVAAGDIPAVVRKVEPSVVTIFVGNGLGSGVVWAKDRTVVTNHHVIESAGTGGRAQVAFAGGRRVAGRVRASDPITDLAVVKADRTDVP